MKILGIDYGRSKIGLAVGDTETGLVEPLAGGLISRIIKENQISKIVIGIPGGKMDKEIKTFGKNLNQETGLPVEFFDETLTTQDAQRELLAGGRKRKNRHKLEDAIAAAIMLELFIEGGK